MTIVTNSKQGLPQPGLDAAREGRTFCCFVNEDTALNTAGGTVVTDAGATQNIEAGRRYIVASYYFALTSVADSVQFEIVTTSLPNGGGAVTAQTPRFFAGTGAANDTRDTGPIHLDPPLVFTRDDGQSIAMRVLTNDADADVTIGFTGWWETDD